MGGPGGGEGGWGGGAVVQALTATYKASAVRTKLAKESVRENRRNPAALA